MAKLTLNEVRDSITKDELRSIRFGDLAAFRDFRKLIEHNAEHQRRHQADPEWSCKEFTAEFNDNLGADLDRSNFALGFGYQRTKAFLAERTSQSFELELELDHEQESISSQGFDSILDRLGIQTVLLEEGPREGEEPQDFIARLTQAVQDKFDLEAMAAGPEPEPVSETPDQPDQPADNDQSDQSEEQE